MAPKIVSALDGRVSSDPVLATNDPFDITANADIHALDRFGRSVLKMDYKLANGTILRSVSGYQKGQTEYRTDLDGTSTGNNIFGDIANEDVGEVVEIVGHEIRGRTLKDHPSAIVGNLRVRRTQERRHPREVRADEAVGA